MRLGLGLPKREIPTNTYPYTKDIRLSTTGDHVTVTVTVTPTIVFFNKTSCNFYKLISSRSPVFSKGLYVYVGHGLRKIDRELSHKNTPE